LFDQVLHLFGKRFRNVWIVNEIHKDEKLSFGEDAFFTDVAQLPSLGEVVFVDVVAGEHFFDL
jgi:hypothetical protein